MIKIEELGDIVTISGFRATNSPGWYYTMLIIIWGVDVPIWLWDMSSFWDCFAGGIVLAVATAFTVLARPFSASKYSKNHPNKLIKCNCSTTKIRYYENGEPADEPDPDRFNKLVDYDYECENGSPDYVIMNEKGKMFYTWFEDRAEEWVARHPKTGPWTIHEMRRIKLERIDTDD